MTGLILFLRIPSHILGRFSTTIFLDAMGADARSLKNIILGSLNMKKQLIVPNKK